MNQTARRRILFVCIHNSGRSQMAEAMVNRLGGDQFIAESAGCEPRPVHPGVIQVMREIGYDLSDATSDNLFDFFRQGRLYEKVIYVCERAAERDCPVFPGVRQVLHWPFDDPSQLAASDAAGLQGLRDIRDAIE
ncbi:MAG: arsenate reductase ArsC, partial [Guyparkeria sp.]|uniref:arsenate reductase ArsC n=1 Tax=Guyparkeria sp. TaxID=2035736 RepID=UPI00397D2990